VETATPDEAIVRVLTEAERSLTLAEIVDRSGVEEIDVVDALPRLLRAGIIEPDLGRKDRLAFKLSDATQSTR
jgi:GTP-sensing pleiotropic transcriptional regulator CodY